MPKRQMGEYIREYENKKTKSWLNVHSNADTTDLDYNIEKSKRFVDDGYNVKILEHSFEDGVKNPEIEINGDKGDFKSPKTNRGKSIKNLVESANDQEAKFAAIVLDERKLTIREQLRGINAALGNRDWYKSIEYIYLLYPTGAPVKIMRSEVYKWTFVKKLRKY